MWPGTFVFMFISCPRNPSWLGQMANHLGSAKRVVLLQCQLMLTQDEELYQTEDFGVQANAHKTQLSHSLNGKNETKAHIFLNTKGRCLWHLTPTFLILYCSHLLTFHTYFFNKCFFT